MDLYTLVTANTAVDGTTLTKLSELRVSGYAKEKDAFYTEGTSLLSDEAFGAVEAKGTCACSSK